MPRFTRKLHQRSITLTPENTTDLPDILFARMFRAGGIKLVTDWLATRDYIHRAAAARQVC